VLRLRRVRRFDKHNIYDKMVTDWSGQPFFPVLMYE